MTAIGRYAIWLALPATALVAVLAWSGLRPPPTDPNFETQLRAQDRKLKRTILFHEMAGRSGDLPPLSDVNREGLAIELRVDPETWALMQVKNNRRHYKRRPVNVAIQFAGRRYRAATIRLRGKGTLRMSHQLNLEVKLFRAAKLAPGVSLKRFRLVAMIEDVFQVKTVFGYRVFRELGLFPPWFQYVRLAVNGEPLGMVLLVEPGDRGIRRTYPGAVAVYRRESANLFKTYWTAPVPDAGQSLAALRGLNRSSTVEDPLAAYGQAIHLDGYFSWLAVNVILRNHDHLDELFLYEVRSDRSTPTPLRFMGWDPDSMMAPYPKRGSVPDPLLYSGLGALEFRIKETPALYARYREVFRGLLDGRLSVRRLEEILESVAALRDSLDDGRPAKEQADWRRERRVMVGRMKELIRLGHRRLRGLLEER